MTSPRDLRALVRMAQDAEDAGIDGVMLSEHIVLGPSAGAHGRPANPRDYAAPGNQDPATPWPDSIVLMSAIAAATTRLRLIGAAIIAPLRHPLLLAHQLATLDLLSEGRLVVQPTVSWHREEYEALGVPFEQRGELLDEHLAAWSRAVALDAGELRRALLSASTTSTWSPSRSGPTGRGCGSAGCRSGRGSCGGSSRTGTAFIPSASRPRPSMQPLVEAMRRRRARHVRARGRRRDSRRAAAPATASPTWTGPPRRSRPSSRPATRRSASSPRSSPTTRPRSGGCAAGWWRSALG